MTDTTAIMLYSHEKTHNNTKDKISTKTEGSANKIDPKDPKLLDTIARKYACKITGEVNIIKTLLCAFVSKDLPKDYRLSIIIANSSSAGKSYLLNNILTPFKSDLIDFTDFTEAYLKRACNNVDGKIIKLEQLEHNNDAHQLSIQKLKHLLTEGILRFGLADKNENNTIKPKEFVVKGFPVFVTTSTKFEIDPETANRVFMVQLDEGEEQTKRIIKHTLNRYAKLRSESEWDSNIKDLQEFFVKLKNVAHHIERIAIPFAEKIEELLPKRLEIRRDLNKILNLTCLVAFIHCLNRPQIVHKAGKTFIKDQWTYEREDTYTIVAKPEDFHEALEIASNTIKQTINKSSMKQIELFDQLKKLWNDKAEPAGTAESKFLTVKEIAEYTKRSPNRARELLKPLVDNEFVFCDDSTKEHKYYVRQDKKFSELESARIVFTREDFDEWIKANVESDSTLSVVRSCDYESDLKEGQFINATSQSNHTMNVSCNLNNSVPRDDSH